MDLRAWIGEGEDCVERAECLPIRISRSLDHGLLAPSGIGSVSRSDKNFCMFLLLGFLGIQQVWSRCFANPSSLDGDLHSNSVNMEVETGSLEDNFPHFSSTTVLPTSM